MIEPVSISLRRGVIKFEGQVHLAAGLDGIQEAINELEMELIGCVRQKAPVVVELPSPAPRAAESDIPRTGLIDKKQMQRLFRMSRSTLDQRIADGIIPRGGLDGGRRVWNAEPMWALAEKLASNQAPPRETQLCTRKSA